MQTKSVIFLSKDVVNVRKTGHNERKICLENGTGGTGKPVPYESEAAA